MNKKEKIEAEINKTLAQFEDAEQLPPNPYFHTRVQVRLDETRRQKHLLSAILKPALLTALVAVNIGTAAWYLGETKQAGQIETRQELVELLDEDLNPDNTQTTLLTFE